MGHDGYGALHNATGMGNLRMIQLLVSHGADINLQSDGKEKSGQTTPLHLVVRVSALPIVHFFLSLPECNPNIKDINGERPIHLAAAPVVNWNFSSQIILTLLLAHPKVDPNGSGNDDEEDR